MTQKNRTILFLEYDSKNWLFFEYDPKNWTSVEKIFKSEFWKTRKIKPFPEKYDSKNWSFFCVFFPKNDSNNWSFFIWLKELNPLFVMSEWIEPIWQITRRIEPFFEHDSQIFFKKKKKRIRLTELNFFSDMTQSIELFFVWLSLWIELFFQEIWLDSSNWTSCYEPLFNMTQRIEPLVMNLFSIWLKELNPSQNVSKNWTSLSLKELNFFQYDAKFFQIDSKELNPLFSMTQRIELFFQIWRKEWNPCSLNTTQRIEPFFLWIRRKELNPFFEYDAKNRILFLWIWRKELKALFKMTGRIEPSRKNCSKTWTFFFELDAKNRTFFLNATQNLKFFVWKIVKTLNSFQKIMTQRIELFSQKNDAKFFFFEKNLIRRMEPSWKYDFQTKTWLKELNPSYFDSENWFCLRLKELNFSSNMAQRIEFLSSMSQRMGVFLVWLKELDFLKYESKISTFFFSNTQRVAPFFFEYDAKSWTLFLSIRRKELNPFLSSDAKNWTILSRSMTQRIEPCVKKKLKECNSC